MGFKFEIQEGFEIHRDPGGHHHHWSILFGYLRDGMLEKGKSILIKSKVSLAARLIDWQFHPKSSLARYKSSTTINSAQLNGEVINIRVYRVAPRNSDVPKGTIITQCSDEERIEILTDLLRYDPTYILHGRGEENLRTRCHDCYDLSNLIPNAHEILSGHDMSTNFHVAEYLKRFAD